MSCGSDPQLTSVASKCRPLDQRQVPEGRPLLAAGRKAALNTSPCCSFHWSKLNANRVPPAAWPPPDHRSAQLGWLLKTALKQRKRESRTLREKVSEAEATPTDQGSGETGERQAAKMLSHPETEEASGRRENRGGGVRATDGFIRHATDRFRIQTQRDAGKQEKERQSK